MAKSYEETGDFSAEEESVERSTAVYVAERLRGSITVGCEIRLQTNLSGPEITRNKLTRSVREYQTEASLSVCLLVIARRHQNCAASVPVQSYAIDL